MFQACLGILPRSSARIGHVAGPTYEGLRLPVEQASVIQIQLHFIAAAWCVTSTRHGNRFMVTWTFECKQDVQQG